MRKDGAYEIHYWHIGRILFYTNYSNLKLYNLISMFFKYLFVIIIYYFIFNIIKMIYLDIKGTNNMNYSSNTYLKLINRKENLPFKIQEHYFIGRTATIGRDDSNQVALKDRFISKRHARIYKEKNNYYIEDLNSANGTFWMEINWLILQDWTTKIW